VQPTQPLPEDGIACSGFQIREAAVVGICDRRITRLKMLDGCGLGLRTAGVGLNDRCGICYRLYLNPVHVNLLCPYAVVAHFRPCAIFAPPSSQLTVIRVVLNHTFSCKRLSKGPLMM